MDELRDAANAASITLPRSWRMRQWIRRNRWPLGVFFGTLFIFLIASINLIINLHITGDEPAYLLQGYAIIHLHTVEMNRVVSDPQIYRQFFNHAPLDRVYDFRGNGVEMEAYLPGYAAIIGLLYALGGRFLIVAVQSIAAALTALLMFQETDRLWHSRAVDVFVTIAYLSSLPALLFAGQLFPSTLATLVGMVAFVLILRVLPAAQGTKRLITAAGIGLLAALFPWLHVKYAPLALLIIAAALVQLFLLMRASTHPQPAVSSLANPAKEASSEVAQQARAGVAWLAAGILCLLPAISFLLIALYSHHYFGTWYPQYRADPSTSYASPDIGHMLLIYQEMFLDGQSGLIPWAPLMLLVPAGLIALARYHLKVAIITLLWIFGFLVAFASSAVAPHVNQAYALPARFTVECQPFFALCVASLFARCWPSLRTTFTKLTQRHGMSLSQLVNLRVAFGLMCLLLLAVDIWFTLVGQTNLGALYPNARGITLAMRLPHSLPLWWFSLFSVH